ncbi:MAG: UDP-N-acetylmuramoyl-L-alanine--D-glutamate ligase [Bacteroidales bacterium]|nr:UDP-N-acetylmuramoyl-L-alanine--D-glutamate ligase [Bacteroidales bacterium]
MFEKILDRLSGRRVLILGFGREGKSTLSFLRKYLPDLVVGVADRNEKAFEGSTSSKGLSFHSGESYLDALCDYEVVVKTPGISLLGVDTKGVEITSQTDLFLSQFHEHTIGISGTKGKSTTTSLIYHLLKSSGHDAILTGNIGIPCFDVMERIAKESVVVYELSAHQLEYVHNSPKVGVLLNVFEEHLDHFGTFERYRQAKFNLLRFMGEDDFAVVHDSLMMDTLGLGVNNVTFSRMEFDIDEEALPLLGPHNLLNVKAALCACAAYGVDVQEVIPYLYSFKPLEHRLEPVGTYGGVRFVNDSISTIPQATIAACQTLGKVDFLLLGGFDRDIDYMPLVEFLTQFPVAHLLFTGKAGERMMCLIKDRGVTSHCQPYATMEEAFNYLRLHAASGDVCLLSPAASSYDQYKNFEERGGKFKRLAAAFQRA